MTPHLPASGERRQYTDRRSDSPKFREWVNGLSRLGKIAIALAVAIGGALAARGASVPPVATLDTSALAARMTAAEARMAVTEARNDAIAALLASIARRSCLNSTDEQVGNSQLPCDSLMRGIGDWRAMRPESLRVPVHR